MHAILADHCWAWQGRDIELLEEIGAASRWALCGLGKPHLTRF
jgi:hypothetical protein